MAAAIPKNRYFVFFAIATIGCLIDLATKHWVFDWLGAPGPESRVYWLWPEYIGLQTSLNEGALFGFGQGKVFLFATLSVVAAIGIPIWLFYARAATDWLLCIALACVTAGIFGNLYDRLALHGLTWHVPPKMGEPVYAVRDFVLLQLNNQIRWPNFNVADSMLVCGAALLLWHALYPPTATQGTSTEDPSRPS
jgi:signal peptidase II